MAAENDNDTPDAVIEDNKVVRRMRAHGCICAWHWVDNGTGDGGTMPGIETLNPGCPVTGTDLPPHP